MDQTDIQTYLLQFIEFYSSIYELDDVQRPSDDIIEDDEDLDSWCVDRANNTRDKLVEYYKQIDENHANATRKNFIRQGKQPSTGRTKVKIGSVGPNGGSASHSIGGPK